MLRVSLLKRKNILIIPGKQERAGFDRNREYDGSLCYIYGMMSSSGRKKAVR